MDRLTACNGQTCYGIGYGETLWWFEDYSTDNYFVDYEYPWVHRSGFYDYGSGAGAFVVDASDGIGSYSLSFRSALVVTGA